ncbi:hypothetical protein FQN54_003550 [Arachnomyces sp. PD_36]|nr:hypothetical protein FQN54_003550 [Arachnomyces sp. PD_36]
MEGEEPVGKKRTRRGRKVRRRRKYRNTVNSLNPDRAPVGSQSASGESDPSSNTSYQCSSGQQSDSKTEPDDIDNPFANLSVNPLIGEDLLARVRSFSSKSISLSRNFTHHNSGRCLVHAPAPLRDNSSGPVSTSQKEESVTETGRLAPLPRPIYRPRSAGATPLSKEALTGRNIPGEVPDIPLPIHNTSNAPNQDMGSNMGPSGPSFSSQARAAELNAAAAAKARTFSGGLEEHNNGILSRPIPTGPSKGKAPIRSGLSKSWRQINFEEAMEASPPGIVGRESHRSVNPAMMDSGHRRASMGPYPLQGVTDMEPHGIHEHRNISMGPSRRPTPYWLHDMNTHLQANMLSAPRYYGPSSESSFSPHHRHPATIPHPRAFVSLRGAPLGPDDLSPTKQEQKSAFRASQDDVISQNPLFEDPFMAEQSHHPYGPSFPYNPQPDPHIAYGFGPPVYSPQSGHAEMEYPFPSQGVEGDSDQYVAYAPAPPLDHQSTNFMGPQDQAHVVGIPNKMPPEIVGRARTPIQAAAPMVQSSVGSATKPLSPPKTQPTGFENRDTKRDMTAYLNGVIETSKANWGKDKVLERGIHGTNQHPKFQTPLRVSEVKAHGGLFFPHIDFTSLPSQPPTDVFHDEKARQAALDQLDSETIFRKCPRVNVKAPRTGKLPMESLLSMPMPGKFDQASDPETNPAFKFPPPGLPFPENMGQANSLKRKGEPDSSQLSRLGESNRSFHADSCKGLGDGKAMEYMPKTREEQGVNYDITTNASSAPLAKVLLNLISYMKGDPETRATHLANFGPVDPSVADLFRPDDVRSYFDYDPTVPWDFQPGFGPRDESGYPEPRLLKRVKGMAFYEKRKAH